MELLNQIDTTLFLFFNTTFANPALDWFFVTITTTENWYIPLLTIAFFSIVRVQLKPVRIGVRTHWRLSVTAIVLCVVAVGVTDPLCARVLKPLFGRPRPCNPEVLVEGGRFLLGYKTSRSMPSIHAANMMAAATVLTWVFTRHWVWYFTIAGLVAFSRVYVGVHYPFDVLAGTVVGIALGSAVYGVYVGGRRLLVRRQPAIDSPDGSSLRGDEGGAAAQDEEIGGEDRERPAAPSSL
ncbi:MAG: phosphatase PAP2 family protein [Chitinivibrionales bacterium]|nr:phosphatase PAP2 family protein [Chitinivibrionales bacterium]